MRYQALKVLKSALDKPGGGGVGGLQGTLSLIWLILECATGQGMVFFVLNRVCNFMCVCQQGIACTIELIC